MKENKKILKRKERGITLIALVITIIVLLILAGVSIAMLTGENGILTQATNAKESTDKATEEEKVNMAVLGSSIADNGYSEILDEASFRQELTNQFGNNGYDLVVNGDGSFIITVKESQRKYYVNDDKTVINSDNIIEISSAEELMAFRDDVNGGNSYEGKAVLLTSDITLSGEWEPIGYYDQTTDEKNPDTDKNKPFRGIFDGGNYTIDGINITLNRDKKVQGFFAFAVNASIRNIVIGKKCEIFGNELTAGVIGYLYGEKGNISNCVNNANINGSAGIVGEMVGSHIIFNCKNYGEINGAAGILGSCASLDFINKPSISIVNCLNNGNITKTDTYYAGGIVGYFYGKEILNCYNKGKIISNSSFVGGIAGQASSDVINCYSVGSVEGRYCIGGIIGWIAREKSVVSNCYFSGEITTLEVGKNILIGEGEENSEIVNCYTKNDSFTAVDLGDAFKEDTENKNNGYPLLYWE